MVTEQIALDIYDIDEKATRRAVEKSLKKARFYKETEYIPEEPSMTPKYSLVPPSETGLTSDQTARVAIKNADETDRRRQHIERVEKAVSRLSGREQKIIRMRYLDGTDMMDFEIALEIGMTPRHYRRVKSYAIYKLASALGLVVLKE